MGCNTSTTICYPGGDYISLADFCQKNEYYDDNDVIYCKKVALYNNIGALYYLKTYYHHKSIIEEKNMMIKFAIHSLKYKCLVE
uniref:Uncharacterized protein n=1 Tax=Mimivirus LCMiAC02 TaxID=2506609 RepID=A0A481Z4A8_9VIRU|nr:MAG: hypothetical protein LCMiAC02_05650 [Mimivirus LCMiAC02]